MALGTSRRKPSALYQMHAALCRRHAALYRRRSPGKWPGAALTMISLLIVFGAGTWGANDRSGDRGWHPRRLRGDVAVGSAEDPVAPQCASTLQGRIMVTDDRGYTCRRWEMDFATGCCHLATSSHATRRRASSKSLLAVPERVESLETPEPLESSTPSSEREGGRYSCATCNLTSGCCMSYEHCVSCCLAPERTPAAIVLAMPRAQQPSAKPFQSVFEFCSMRCRHNSKSVVHENAYITERHHCFPVLKSEGSTPKLEHLGQEIKLIVAAQGMACDDACAKLSLGCDAAYFPLLNNCTVLREHMRCRSGCIVSSGPDQPAEVADTAPPRQSPGACVVNRTPDLFGCSGYHENTRRLCPCATARPD